MKNVLFRSSFKALLRTLLAAAAAFVWFSGQAQLPAFPGAEGYGKYASGGRGTLATPTTVFEVTSLEDINTPGTLRNALSAPATYRTVVFRVAGTIRLKSKLSIPANTTIAGQTAPGGGICLADHPVVISGDNVILRFIRVRMGDRYQNKGKVDGSGGDDALGNLGNKRLIIDHCSVSWSSDEALTIYRGDSVTLQWNIISGTAKLFLPLRIRRLRLPGAWLRRYLGLPQRKLPPQPDPARERPCAPVCRQQHLSRRGGGKSRFSQQRHLQLEGLQHQWGRRRYLQPGQ
ncbi:MAG: hypothetical protein IPK21_05590 [Haliscomenobacter sp.]|nr:hypothetical protein [Haliscomenobacter sp.]